MRIFRVTPPNPLLMSAGEREKTAAAFQRLVSQLGAEETLQIYIDARPVNLDELLADCRREVQASAGPRAEREDGRPAGVGAVAAVRGDGGVAAPARRRAGGGAGRAATWSCRWCRARASPGPRWRGRGAAGCRRRRWSGRCRRTGGRCASSSRMSTRCAQSSRPRAWRPSCSTASRSLRLLWARFNPTKADDTRRRAAPAGVEVLGSSTRRPTGTSRAQAALGLREQIAPSSLDFRASHQHVVVDRDVEQTILIANTRGAHADGLAARGDADPPAVHAVGVRARAGAPPRAPEAQARLPAAVHDQPRRRAARPRPGLRPLRAGARVPRAAGRDGQRREAEPVPRLGLPDAPRARTRTRTSPRSPRRSTSARSRSSRRGTARSAAASFASTSCGARACRSGRDLHGRARKYPTANAGDMLPLIGTKCGSPTGVPFAFADPGRTVELHQPLRRGARQPHARDQRPQRLGKDDDRQRAPVALPGRWARAGS